MQVERTCITCNEDAALFCRLCATNQCYDHMCLHLSVAHSDNTWTKRHERDYENQRSESHYSSENYDEYEDDVGQQPAESSAALEIPIAARSILSYSEAQLREQYTFYTSQARRIRIELERRSLPAEGLLPSGRVNNNAPKMREFSSRQKNISLGRGACASRDILLRGIRAGDLKVEDIIAKLTHMQAANTAGN